ncbi:MAG: CRTAC1 family protein [Gemmatimonadota bacterium]|nr:CRTAC1 family protein [Gemmatimonadota bacterium]
MSIPDKKQDKIQLEEAPGDDAVIGKAFRWSLPVFGAIAVIVLVAVYLNRRSGETAPERYIDVTGPETVTENTAAPVVRFTDISEEAGIDFVHSSGAYGDKLLPETMGGGAAFFDYDNDGDQDLLFINSANWPHKPAPSPAPTMRLYRNDGRGHFDDVTVSAGLSESFYGMGAAVADYDADGWTDVFITAVGSNHLYRNRNGTFQEETARAGVSGKADSWSSSAGFFDYDNDGDPDLFVANYVQWSKDIDLQIDFRLAGVGRAYGPPQEYAGSFSYLYRNNGDGTFDDVSESSGIQIGNPASGVPVGKALALAPMDVDQDGWLDLFIANDTVRNFFFHNNGDGTFEETGEIFGLAYGPDGNATGAMGVDGGHYRNDRHVGFMIGNFANEMTSVYVSQDDPGLFVDDAIGEGIGAPSRRVLTFGLFLFDYDLDGRLDMLQTNGHIEAEINRVDPSQTYAQAAQLFWNAGLGQNKFVHVAPQTVGDLNRKIVGRAAAYADIDEDGDLDVVLTQTGGPALVLRNDQDLGHHWLRVRLTGRSPDSNVIGSWIELTAGGFTQRRQMMPTRSYLSQVELPVTFGLGTVDRIDDLKVIWPDGTEQTVLDVPVDQVLEIER